MKALNLFLPFLLLAFSIFAGYVIHREAWLMGHDSSFVKLSQSFLRGDLFLSPMNLPDGDYADYRARQYLFFGPLPSVVLMPFVAAFGPGFSQWNLAVFGLIATYVLVFKLCRRLKFDRGDSFWLANFFVFGTSLYFVGVVNISAYLVQVIAMPFVVAALYEYFSKRRWFLIGILVACAVATRVTYLGICVFFVFEIFRMRGKVDFTRALTYFLIPVAVCVLVLGAYNFRRFGSPFDTGYTRNVSVLDKGGGNQQRGFFSVVHIPGNLYSLLLMAPEVVRDGSLEFVLKFPYLKANGWGMGMLFTSPLFIFLAASKKKEYTVSAIFSTIALVLPSLVYFGIGASQYGYRYGLDFVPVLFLILLTAFGNKLGTVPKILITVGIIFNLFYMLSIWNSYPLFFWFTPAG